MEPEIINPFIEGTFHILGTTASVKSKPETPYIKDSAVATGDMTSLLSLSGDVNGTVSISFTEKSILEIVSAMFGEPMTKLDEEIVDAVGEIGNMISGNVTSKMTEIGKKIKVQLAKVIQGHDHVIGHADGKKILAMPFKSTKGYICIEICY